MAVICVSQEIENIDNILKIYIKENNISIDINNEEIKINGNLAELEIIKIINILRLYSDITADNIANVSTTRTIEGGPFQRNIIKIVNGNGEIVKINKTKSVYDPTHPDASQDGYVSYPDIDIVHEMENMIEISRIYENFLEQCEFNGYKIPIVIGNDNITTQYMDLINYPYKRYYNLVIIEDYVNINTAIEFLEYLKLNIDVARENIENSNNIKTTNGEYYYRKYIILLDKKVTIAEDKTYKWVYDPTLPEAYQDGSLKGYVKYPNIDIVTETVNLMVFSRMYSEIIEQYIIGELNIPEYYINYFRAIEEKNKELIK
jgi:flagellar basal-body rod protein FlgC